MNLSQLLDGNSAAPGGGAQASLDSILNGFISSVSASVAKGVSNVVENKTRSSNTAPVPDITAAAAMPQVSTFLNGQAFGVSMPILLIGVGALAFVLLRR